MNISILNLYRRRTSAWTDASYNRLSVCLRVLLLVWWTEKNCSFFISRLVDWLTSRQLFTVTLRRHDTRTKLTQCEDAALDSHCCMPCPSLLVFINDEVTLVRNLMSPRTIPVGEGEK